MGIEQTRGLYSIDGADTELFTNYSLYSPIDYGAVLEKTHGEYSQIFQKLQIILSGISGEYRERFWTEFATLEGSLTPSLYSRAINLIQQYNFDAPSFKILSHDDPYMQQPDLKKLLSRTNPNNLITIFNLPKPLSQFWRKSSVDIPPNEIDVMPNIIPWGALYRSTIPVIKSRINDQNKLRRHGDLHFHRLNNSGDHKELLYYHAWDIRER